MNHPKWTRWSSSCLHRNTNRRWTFLAGLNFCCIASSNVGFEVPGALHLEAKNENLGVQTEVKYRLTLSDWQTLRYQLYVWIALKRRSNLSNGLRENCSVCRVLNSWPILLQGHSWARGTKWNLFCGRWPFCTGLLCVVWPTTGVGNQLGDVKYPTLTPPAISKGISLSSRRSLYAPRKRTPCPTKRNEYARARLYDLMIKSQARLKYWGYLTVDLSAVAASCHKQGYAELIFWNPLL